MAAGGNEAGGGYAAVLHDHGLDGDGAYVEARIEFFIIHF
jgi:hypothetical protein